MTKSIEKSNESAPVIVELSLQEQTLALKETSKMIRFLATKFVAKGDEKPYAWIERQLKTFGVRTRNGDPIRYQHVRNVMLTPLTGK